MKRCRLEKWLLAVFFAWGTTGLAAAQKIPTVQGTTFSGAPVNLPGSLSGKTAVLVIGFSQGARQALTEWGKRLAADYYDSPSVLYYEMPMLASVPRPLRGFVAGRIKSSVSDRGKVHFVPLTDSETEWKKLSHFAAADDAYLLVVDGRGIVRWQTHGPLTDAAYAAMKHEVEALGTQRAAAASR